MTITFISTTIGMVVGAITGAGTATAILYTKLIQREIEKKEGERMMTREEALRELMDIRDEATAYPDSVCYVTSEDEDALNVAIEALNSVMDTENDTVKTENDVIKRQDAVNSDLIRREDSIALVIKAMVETDNEEIQNYLFDGLRRQMWSLPSADAVEVVRCKDCIHWFPHTQCGFDEDNDEYHDYCGLLIPDDDYYAYTRKPDDYCSYGERREDGE